MIRSNQRPVLAVDLGGTKIIAAVVVPDGKVISRSYCLTLAEEGPKAVIERLLSAVSEALVGAELKNSEIAGVGMAAAGIIDAKKGVITTSPNLPGWHDVPLRDVIAERIGLATYLVNDASAAALGEHRFGAGKGLGNLIYLTVSTGIGGGIIIDGRLYTGTDGCAGEIGHMTIEAHGPQCNCGNFGCLEALASGSAMTREAVRRMGQGEPSSIAELARGRLMDVTAEMIAVVARQGDKMACEIVADAANYLGIGLANLVNIFNPEVIVIGGGVSSMGNMLLGPARKVVKERAFKLPLRTVRIIRARLGSNAEMMGAAVYVFDQQLAKRRKT
ncbi:MAG: ROK family protein [Chloroflexi bacterium]|nr:ROK family protein [Chloroflexota bacterium]